MSDHLAVLAKRKTSCNYCGICGRTPLTNLDEPNYTPLRWWDPDDGWKIGTLCRWCWEEVADDKPKPADFAFEKHRNDACSTDPETDEDPIDALDDDGGAA